MAKQFREPLCTTKMGDRGLEPLTSCVSSRRSANSATHRNITIRPKPYAVT